MIKASTIEEHKDTVQCREDGLVLSSEKWEVGKETSFQWMPGGITSMRPSYNDRPIRLTVQCTEETARVVQASFDQWLAKSRQKPFGCVEHRAQEAAIWPNRFEWKNEPEPGVFCSGEPTELGAHNVNGRIHRSWSPTFTTNAEYHKCVCSDCKKQADVCECGGDLEFPDGAIGSAKNPAKVTGVAFSIGSLTNKPAFKNIMPVRAKEADENGEVQAGAQFGNQNAAGPHRHRIGKPRKNEFGEWKVPWYEGGRQHEGRTYYTDDEEDAKMTHAQMVKQCDAENKKAEASEDQDKDAIKAARIKQHQSTSKTGKVFTVKEHEDSRSRHHKELAARHPTLDHSKKAHAASAKAWASGSLDDHFLAKKLHMRAANETTGESDTNPNAHIGYADQHGDFIREKSTKTEDSYDDHNALELSDKASKQSASAFGNMDLEEHRQAEQAHISAAHAHDHASDNARKAGKHQEAGEHEAYRKLHSSIADAHETFVRETENNAHQTNPKMDSRFKSAQIHLDQADSRNPNELQRQASEKWLKENRVVDEHGELLYSNENEDILQWWEENRASDKKQDKVPVQAVGTSEGVKKSWLSRHRHAPGDHVREDVVHRYATKYKEKGIHTFRSREERLGWIGGTETETTQKEKEEIAKRVNASEETLISESILAELAKERKAVISDTTELTSEAIFASLATKQVKPAT